MQKMVRGVRICISHVQMKRNIIVLTMHGVNDVLHMQNIGHIMPFDVIMLNVAYASDDDYRIQ